MEQRKRSWLTRRDKVELFEQIRREYEFGVGTISGVSRKLGVHRRMVREALNSAVPAGNKPQPRRLRKLEAASAFIDRVLKEDREAPRKQRHTAHRIWQRLSAEVPGFVVSERSVRGYVSRRRRQLGLVAHEVFVPQSYDWGVEAQVDWYEAWAVLGGERVKLQVFEMRSMASGGAYHRAYTHATQRDANYAGHDAGQSWNDTHRAWHNSGNDAAYDHHSDHPASLKSVMHGLQHRLT